jgi:ABC-type nickel/cobalt efflux system permease component RcnA
MNFRLRPVLIALSPALLALTVLAHPLGQFTINHYVRIESAPDRVKLRYVVDLAEIAAFQELQAADTDSSGSLSEAESQAYLERSVAQWLSGIHLTADGQPVALRVTHKILSLPPGTANLPTMRIECDFEGAIPASSGTVSRLRFEDGNHRDRQGWRELVVIPAAGASLFDSTAFGSGLTDELKAYPEDMLLAPLNERTAEWAVTAGAVPAGARPLLTRAGKPLVSKRDRFAELITDRPLTPGFALLALLLAFVLGAGHALSPGHGKTIVGAYLVGSKGTVKHAAFLGLTVTITHTLSVYVVLLITIAARHYFHAETFIQWLSILSGVIVVVMGLSLFMQRLRSAFNGSSHSHDAHKHSHAQAHSHAHSEAHSHSHDDAHVHAHGGRAHSHLPPEQVTWRSLLALGVVGGLLPCPSAMTVALGAIGLDRAAFGLLLIVAFSLGLAGVLTGIGIAFVYAGDFIENRGQQRRLFSAAARALPAVSALVIAAAGVFITWQALVQAGVDFRSLLATEEPASSLSTISVMTLGLILGLKHAVEADHLAAVTAIVSERKSLLSSTIVGGLWGVGHTIPILLVGLLVIILRLEIRERVGLSLEFCVGLMLIALGAHALWKLLRGDRLHLHAHKHGGHVHLHPHFHEKKSPHEEAQTHHGFRLGLRPLFVGMMHGLAGSAALVPLVVAEIRSPLVGMFYMLVFGCGSIGGMMLMSSLVGLPLHLTASRFVRFNYAMRALAGLFSVGFGLFMVYKIGFTEGLLR